MRPTATWAITDGNQRRDVGFGGVRNNTSYLLGPGQSAGSKPAHIPLTYSVAQARNMKRLRRRLERHAVTASSYGSSLVAQPTEGPYSAFDGNPSTAWVADATDNSIGQWISIRFDHPVPLTTITVTPLAGSPQQPRVSQLTISTDRGSTRPRPARHIVACTPDRSARQEPVPQDNHRRSQTAVTDPARRYRSRGWNRRHRRSWCFLPAEHEGAGRRSRVIHWSSKEPTGHRLQPTAT